MGLELVCYTLGINFFSYHFWSWLINFCLLISVYVTPYFILRFFFGLFAYKFILPTGLVIED